MPTVFQRAQSATKQVKKWVIGGGSAVGTGLGLSATAAGVSAMLPAAAGTGLVVGAAVAAPVLVAGGLLFAGGAAVYGAYRALWPRDREKYHDKAVELKDLEDEYWSCHIIRVGVVGVKRSGKTEIKTRLRDQGQGERDTAHIETHIFRADKDKNIFVALIDGQGADTGERQQQFKIADQAQLLVIVLDHNELDENPSIATSRLNEHDEFLKQLRSKFNTRPEKQKNLRVIFILNKKDLWSTASPQDRQAFENWFSKNVAEWSQLGISVGEKPIEMSAREPSHIVRLKQEIVDAAEHIYIESRDA
jgi:hypothetical protein